MKDKFLNAIYSSKDYDTIQTASGDYDTIETINESEASEKCEQIADLIAVDFAKWLINLPASKRVTVHPPAGSGGSHGIYELSYEELLFIYKKESKI